MITQPKQSGKPGNLSVPLVGWDEDPVARISKVGKK